METLFDDGVKMRTIIDNLTKNFEIKKFEEITKQIEADAKTEWGDGLNVLLISDRAPGRAEGLCTYLILKTEIKNIRLCMNMEQVREYLGCVIPDIVIFIEMADEKENYQAISMAKEANRFVMAVMYGFLDYDMKVECERYKIQYAFSSNKPLREGLSYLRQAYEENKEKTSY